MSLFPPDFARLRAKLSAFRKAPLALASAGVAMGAAIAILFLPRVSVPGEAPPAGPPFTLLGEKLDDGKGGLETALRAARRFSEKEFVLVLPGAESESLSLSDLGALIDTARLSRLVRDASDPLSQLASAARTAGKPVALPVPVFVDTAAAFSELMRIKDDFDRTAADARLDLEKKAVTPHVVGRSLDVDGTLKAIDDALARGELRATAKLLTREPKRKADELAKLNFESVLGHFETKYSRAQKAADRTFNLRLAASRLDGTVLLPGETFDFNEVVGPRDEANGYRVATVIADGELVDGIGGGTCQVSGTLHGAAFFGGLEIVERYPHTRPSSYIKMGLDATVVYPTINFRLRNAYDFPIVLHETVNGGVVRAEILGAATDQVVTLIRKVDDVLPYEELERPEPKMPKGARVLAQRGIPGFRLHRYRVVRRGSHTVREKWRDLYPPTPQVVAIGSGPASQKSERKDDAAPEFLADELLVLTLRRSKPGEAGDYAENRVKGQYGEPGWTKTHGMHLWERSR